MNRNTIGKRGSIITVLLALAYGADLGHASTLTFSGSITQSTFDGTGPAGNNPSLNNIQDLQNYLVTLTFAGSISGPGTYDLTGATLTFSVPVAVATETSFDAISLTVASNAAFDDLSLLACLTTGSGCAFGNELTANFEIPAAMLNSQNVAATGLDQPHPLDLLEDDGVTDIHGSITTFSNSSTASAVPEPSVDALVAAALIAILCARRQMISPSLKLHCKKEDK